MPVRISPRIVLLILLLVQASTLVARDHDNGRGHRDLTRQQAAEIARQRQPGKVLSVRRMNGKKRPPVYRVKILSKGDVHVITVP